MGRAYAANAALFAATALLWLPSSPLLLRQDGLSSQSAAFLESGVSALVIFETRGRRLDDIDTAFRAKRWARHGRRSGGPKLAVGPFRETLGQLFARMRSEYCSYQPGLTDLETVCQLQLLHPLQVFEMMEAICLIALIHNDPLPPRRFGRQTRRWRGGGYANILSAESLLYTFVDLLLHDNTTTLCRTPASPAVSATTTASASVSATASIPTTTIMHGTHHI